MTRTGSSGAYALLACGLICFGTGAAIAQGRHYDVLEVDTVAGATASFVGCLNNNGTLAGAAIVDDEVVGHITPRRGAPQFISDVEGGFQIQGISSSEATVGISFGPTGLRSLLRSRSGEYTEISAGEGSTAVRDISSGGSSICGSHNLPGPIDITQRFGYGWIIGDDGLTIVEPEGTLATIVLGVNNRGDSVGIALQSFVPQFVQISFIRSAEGEFSTPEVDGAVSVVPNDINDKREVVGSFVGADGFGHGFVQDASGTTVVDIEIANLPETIEIPFPPFELSLVGQSTSIAETNDRGDILVNHSALYSAEGFPFRWGVGRTLIGRLTGVGGDGHGPYVVHTKQEGHGELIEE